MNKTRRIQHGILLACGITCFSTRQTLSAGPEVTPNKTGVQIVTPAANPAVTTPAAPIPFYKTYIYYGDRYRDPFIPLNGDFRGDSSALDRPPPIASLTLKGIVQDAKGRMALLTSGVTSYILKGGRLYDGRNRMIKKIAGVIKTDSVVLIGSDRTVRELKTKSPL
jgi:hypothetical protein